MIFLSCEHTDQITSSPCEPLFRGIADKMDRDDSVDPIVGGTSASEWRMSLGWKNQVARAIESEIDEAIIAKDEANVLQLERVDATLAPKFGVIWIWLWAAQG